jgi:hypothetical protein
MIIKLIDILNETKLFEMAFERKDALRKLDNLSYEISKHLLKLIIFNDSNNFNHWLGELNGWLNQIDSIEIKPNMKKLREEDYLKFLKEHYLENEDQVNKMVQKIKKTYKDEQVIYDEPSFVFDKTETILNRVCLSLSKDTFEPLTEKDFNFNK